MRAASRTAGGAAAIFCESRGEAAGVVGAFSGLPVGRRVEGRGGALHGFDVFRVGRRLLLAGGIEQGPQGSRDRRDDRELFILILGNETLEARDPGDLRQLLQPRHERRGVRERRSENVDRIGVGVRVLHQIQQGCNGFDLGAAQIQRIEIEMKMAEQRRSGQGHEQCSGDDRITVIGHETIDGSQKLIADRLLFRRRPQQSKQGRQDRDRGKKCDEHAGAGNQAQFGNAAIIGREKRVEAGGGRRRGKRQRPPGLGRRLHEGLVELRLLIAFGAVADAELNAEIDPDADEQHRKGDRNQIERADHHEPDGGRRGKPSDDAQGDREHDTARFQGAPNDKKNNQGGHRRVEPGAVLDIPEFLVGHRHEARQPHRHPGLGRNPKLARGLADEIRCLFTRHQRRVIEHRLDLDETAQFARIRRLLGDQAAPGKEHRPAGEHALEGIAKQRHRAVEIIERSGFRLDPLVDERNSLDDSAQTRIGGERHQETAGPWKAPSSSAGARRPAETAGRFD